MKLKFKKTPMNNRNVYQYYDANDNVTVTISPDQVEEIQIKLLHSLDDAEVYRRHYTNCFTARIKCGLCGRSLSRVRGRYQCMNSQCSMKGISEDLLMEETAKAMGTKAFDKDLFQKLVDHLELLLGDALRCVFLNGTVVERTFVMGANRDFLLGGRNYPFTHKVKCSHCGAYFTRVSARGGLVRWSHPKSGKACGVKSLSEEKLKDTSKEVLGLEEFIGEEFMALVDCIDVESPTEVVFHLKDGSVVQRQGNFRNTNPRLSEEQLAARRETLKKARAVLSAKRREQKCQEL